MSVGVVEVWHFLRNLDADVYAGQVERRTAPTKMGRQSSLMDARIDGGERVVWTRV